LKESGKMALQKINLSDKLSKFNDHWAPKVVGSFNGHDLMVVKVKGEFNWHSHEDTDDFFMVLDGQITIQMRENNVTLHKGEVFVVPRGIEHCPMAEEECHLLLIEPAGTPNTGNPQTAAKKVEI